MGNDPEERDSTGKEMLQECLSHIGAERRISIDCRERDEVAPLTGTVENGKLAMLETPKVLCRQNKWPASRSEN
jgi:hypothetical protein